MRDADAFPDLETLRRQEAWLRPVVRALVADDAVNDVLQETWLRAWQRPLSHFANRDGWLRRVATRFASSHRRAEVRRRRRENEVGASVPPLAPSTAETVEQLAVQRAVSAAVTQLAEPYRTAVLLRFYHGLSADEVAAKTGTTAANVRQRTHRGLETMRRELERDLGADWRRAPAVAAFLRPGSGAPPSLSLPLVLSMTKLRVASLVVGGLCLLAVGTALLPWFAGDGGNTPNDPLAPVTSRLASAPRDASHAAGTTVDAPAPERSEAAAPRPANSRSPVMGVVLDERGLPVAGVNLGAWSPAREWRQIAVTGTDGAFTADTALPFDPNAIDVKAPWAPIAVQLPGPRTVGVEPMVVVAPGREQVLVVRDETGVPIGGARAIARSAGLVDFPRPLDDAVELQLDATVGDAAGRHRWERLPLAATTITVSKPGFVPATFAIDASTAVEQPVVLTRIAKGQRLVTGVVLDARGGYVRGASVGLGNRETKTDHFGSYALSLEAGAYVDDAWSLFAVGEGWYPAMVENFGRRVNALPEGTLTQDLLLDRRALAIRGRVVDHEGRPQAGVVLYPWRLHNVTDRLTAEDLATGREERPLSLTGNLVHAFARTNADGEFAVPGLDRRPYHLRVYDESEPWAWTSPEIEGGTENVELRLPVDLLGPVRGIVRDRAGRPAAGVDVAPYLEVHANGGGVASVGITKRTKTDADGRFTFARIARHAASLTFGGKEWVQRSVSIDVTAPATAVEVVMMRRCHVRVQLAESSNATADVGFEDAAGATVMIQEDRGSTSMITSLYSLHDGKSEVLSVSEAAVTLVVTHGASDGKEQRFPVSLQPGEVNLIAR